MCAAVLVPLHGEIHEFPVGGSSLRYFEITLARAYPHFDRNEVERPSTRQQAGYQLRVLAVLGVGECIWNLECPFGTILGFGHDLPAEEFHSQSGPSIVSAYDEDFVAGSFDRVPMMEFLLYRFDCFSVLPAVPENDFFTVVLSRCCR